MVSDVEVNMYACVTVSVKIMVFMGDCYYPFGGWEDFHGYFDDVEKAKDYIINKWSDLDRWANVWGHIVEDGKIVIVASYEYPRGIIFEEFKNDR